MAFNKKRSLKKSKRGLVINISDTHSGCKLAAMRPGIQLPGEAIDGKYFPYIAQSTATSTHLWELYLGWVDDIKRLCGKDPAVVIHHGDVTHGNVFKQELISASVADQVIIATDIMRPLADLDAVKAVRFTGGTGVHVFDVGSAEELVTSQLKGLYPSLDVATSPHWRLRIFNNIFDVAHHGASAGSTNWTKGNMLSSYGLSIIMDDLDSGVTPPNVISRGHFHQLITRTVTKRFKDKCYETEMLIVPSLTSMDNYARKASRSAARVTNGLIVWEIIDGKIVERHEFCKTTMLRREETINV